LVGTHRCDYFKDQDVRRRNYKKTELRTQILVKGKTLKSLRIGLAVVSIAEAIGILL
jgi:hypothetical protein